MAHWNSFPLQVIYQVLGWLAFLSWAVCGYPQIILNFRRKSVVGYSLDFEILDITKHLSYLIYNASLFFSPAVQKQYSQKYGYEQFSFWFLSFHGSHHSLHQRHYLAIATSNNSPILPSHDMLFTLGLTFKLLYLQMIPVAANDVAFSTYALILHLIVLSQIAIYERGNQKFSKYAIAIVAAVWFSAAVCFFIALPSQSWLWLVSIFNSIQVCMTLIKYFPQAFMNFMRKSTDGFSIGGVLLDFSGGVFNYSQMAVQSIDQGTWVNFYGNIGKVLISLVTITYDSIFMIQHYVLYPDKKGLTSCKNSEDIKQSLICESPIDQQIKVSV